MHWCQVHESMKNNWGLSKIWEIQQCIDSTIPIIVYQYSWNHPKNICYAAASAQKLNRDCDLAGVQVCRYCPKMGSIKHLMAYEVFNSRHAHIPMVLGSEYTCISVLWIREATPPILRHSTDSALLQHQHPLLAVTLPSRLSTIKIKRMLCLLTHSREAVCRFQSKHFVATQTVFSVRPSPARGTFMC